MTSNTDDNKILVGRFGTTYGVKGWLTVISYTEPANNILQYQPWYIPAANQWQEVTIIDQKIQTPKIIVLIKGYNNKEEAAKLANTQIAVFRNILPQLAENEYYWSDLIGLKVFNMRGQYLGKIIELLSTGSNDVIIIKNKKRMLLPYLDNVVKIVDLSAGQMIVDWDENSL